MRFEDLFDTWGPDDIRLKGHRIALDDVLDLSATGKTAEEIAAFYSTLTADQVRAVLAYYEAHRGEVDSHLASQRQYADEQTRLAEEHPSANALRMRAARRSRAAADTAHTSAS
jgi:uncharacterized protein (DUF433 family)